MSTDTVCRVCLVNNMNLYNVQNNLQNVYERIVREKYETVGYPVHMCYICLTVLQKCHRFMETARDTNNVLKQWYKQQNEMREARPLYTYTIRKAELLSTFNEDMTSQYDIKVEEVESEQEEIQREYAESHIDVKIEKIDIGIDEQTDCSELEVDSLNDRTYTETVEDNNDRQNDPMLDYDEDFEETSSVAPNDHTNIETTINVISPHENDFPPMKEHKTSEAKLQHQTPETSGETTANSETSNDILFLNSTPSQLTYITSHSENQQFECNICFYKFTQNQNLKRHMRTHTGEKPFSCDICHYKCARKQQLTAHMMTHTGEKPFSCDICHYKSTQKQNLLIHMRTHTGEKPFSCDICHYKCARKPRLTRHMMTHTGGKPFSCDICHYKCVRKYDLTRHMIAHTGKISFSCDICHYKCARKYELTRHMMTHTGEKPFSCDICNYKCAEKPQLTKHKMTHTGEKPFSCDMCNYKCIQKFHLKRHMKTHTGEKPFKPFPCRDGQAPG